MRRKKLHSPLHVKGDLLGHCLKSIQPHDRAEEDTQIQIHVLVIYVLVEIVDVRLYGDRFILVDTGAASDVSDTDMISISEMDNGGPYAFRRGLLSTVRTQVGSRHADRAAKPLAMYDGT